MEQVAYFTLKDRHLNPRAVVCIMEINGVVGYGLALKSQTDKWKIGKGRQMARVRALAAINVDDYYFSEHNYIVRDAAHYNIWCLQFVDFNRLGKLMDMGNALNTTKCDIISGFSFKQVLTIFCA